MLHSKMGSLAKKLKAKAEKVAKTVKPKKKKKK